MALLPYFADATAAAANDAVKVLFNSGKLRVYEGTRPTDANTAVGAQLLLGEFTLAASAFGASSASGVTPNRSSTATAAAISDVVAGNNGTASWFRAVKSDGTTVIMDGTVGLSGCDLNLTDITITSGETMRVSSFTLSTPE
jgi:hypothetical protein